MPGRQKSQQLPSLRLLACKCMQQASEHCLMRVPGRKGKPYSWHLLNLLAPQLHEARQSPIDVSAPRKSN